LISALPVLFGVSLVVFLMLHMVPGDPVSVMFADTPLTPDQIMELRENLGLNDPLPQQYARYVANVVQGDLGNSIRTGRPVTGEIAAQIMSTIQLTVAAIGIALVIGVFLGCVAALRRNTWVDGVSMIVALIGVSMPSFWLGLMMIFLFAVRLDWFPAVGGTGLKGLILPATTLGLYAAAIIARVARSSMLEVLGQEYVRTARAKGLRERTVLIRHALRNALVPIVTIVALQIGTLLSGAVIVETVFSRPGLGRLIVNSILAKDFPMVQGAVLVTAVIYVVVNLLADLAYTWLDPRIQHA
jgi:peptide/nickel transport system permease protein